MAAMGVCGICRRDYIVWWENVNPAVKPIISLTIFPSSFPNYPDGSYSTKASSPSSPGPWTLVSNQEVVFQLSAVSGCTYAHLLTMVTERIGRQKGLSRISL